MFSELKAVICVSNIIILHINSISCGRGSNNTDIDNKLTAWSRVLLEKLADRQLVKKFPAFYGTRRFITAFTKARRGFVKWFVTW
jgi:hypothetical protein